MDATGFKPNATSKGDDDMAAMTNLAVLRSYRLNQMCDNFDDPFIAKKLLEEKEKDLELAARIGKALLQRNDDLQKKNELLEEQMGRVGDQVTQLKHELQRKSELLRVFTEDSGDAADFKRTSERASCGTLQRRVRCLEEENAVLKVDITQLKAITIVLKEKEDQIVAEFLRKLAESKRQQKVLCAELQEKQGECDAKENKIRSLTKEMSEKTRNEQKLKEDNELLAAKLRVVQGLQDDLAQELKDLQERYSEVMSMLASAKLELKEAQERQTRFSTSSLADDSLYDSLASELEASDSGYSFNSKPCHLTPVSPTCCPEPELKQLQALENKKSNDANEQLTAELRELFAIEEQYAPEEDLAFDPVELKSEASERAKGIMRSIEAALEMPLYSKGTSCRYVTRLGVPGTPGSKDLEFAIERLSQKSSFEPNKVSYGAEPDHSDDSEQVKMRKDVEPKKPATSRAKLMLVVPVEGSRALAHWKQLATPSGIDPRSWEKLPGINVKSGFGISNSPKIPPPRKQLAVSSVFLNANLPVPASARPKSEIFDSDVTATFPILSSLSTTQLNQQGRGQCMDDNTVMDSSSGHIAPKSGVTLTDKCVGLLNSIGGGWLGPGIAGTVEKSVSSAAVVPGIGVQSKLDNQKKSDLEARLDGFGLLETLGDHGNLANCRSGVVMRSGVRGSK